MSIRQYLKEWRSLRLLVRTAKECRSGWSRVSAELEREEETDKMLARRQRAIQAYLDAHEAPKLQIGAGGNLLSGWLNTDLEPTSPDVFFLDATVNFPFPDNAFDYVFSEHMIEHVGYRQGLFMLAEIFRVLRPGGRVRIATPDMRKIVRLYGAEKSEAEKAYLEWSATEILGLYSPEKSMLQQRRPEWAIDHRHVERFYPEANEDSASFVVNNFFRGFGHQFLYDEQSLSAILLEAGFVDLLFCAPGESNDPILTGIERHGSRIGDLMNSVETMVVEARRP